jgi:hypothetical protein
MSKPARIMQAIDGFFAHWTISPELAALIFLVALGFLGFLAVGGLIRAAAPPDRKA